MRRTVSGWELEELVFLQQFMNAALDHALQGKVPLPKLEVPRALFQQSLMPGSRDIVTVPIEHSASGLYKFDPMFSHDPESQAALAAWEAVTIHGHRDFGLDLTSASLRAARLGDFVAFCFAVVPTMSQSKLFGVAMSLVQQFGRWLDASLTQLLEFKSMSQIPVLKGLWRAYRLDPRRLAMAVDEAAKAQHVGPAARAEKYGQDRDMAKVYVYAYVTELARTMGHENVTRTIIVDGWRHMGESMEQVFSYSPVLNLGGWLPFQVTHAPPTLHAICPAHFHFVGHSHGQ